MAKESMKAKERKRAKLAAQYDERRTALRKAQSQGDWDAMFKLQKLPKNASPVRLHNSPQTRLKQPEFSFYPFQVVLSIALKCFAWRL